MNNDSLWMEAYTEMSKNGEFNKIIQNNPVPVNPDLNNVIKEFCPLPPEALLFGIALDGLPVLLNMHDPIPQSILVSGDNAYLHTKLLQVMASFIGKTASSENVQFAVISENLSEWEEIRNYRNCAGMFEPYTDGAEELVLSLASWAHGNKTSRQVVLLFVDGLKSVADKFSFDARQNLRWLMLRGASRRVWTIATSENKDFDESFSIWTEGFKTNIYSDITNNPLTKGMRPAPKLQNNYMALWEKDDWLRFWIPEL